MSIGIMYKCQKYIDKETLRIVLYTKCTEIKISIFTYCVEIWRNACNIHLDPIVYPRTPRNIGSS